MALADRATATSDGTGTTLTYAHTVAGSSELCIWVGVDDWKSSSPTDPSGVTYAAAALTKLAGNYAGGADNSNMRSVWRRLAPATGANNVVVTHSASHDITAISVSYSGVNQTTPEENIDAEDVNTETTTHAIASESGDLVVDWGGYWNPTGGATFTGGTGAEILENNNGSGVNSMAFAEAPGAASVTMSWDFNTSDGHGQIGFNINASGGAATVVKDLLMGMGFIASPR